MGDEEQPPLSLLDALCWLSAKALVTTIWQVHYELRHAFAEAWVDLSYSPEERRALIAQVAVTLLHDERLLAQGIGVLAQETVERLLALVTTETVPLPKAIPLVTQRPEFRAYVRAYFHLDLAAGGVTVPTVTGGGEEETHQLLSLPIVQYLVGERGQRAVERRARRSAGRTGSGDAGGV